MININICQPTKIHNKLMEEHCQPNLQALDENVQKHIKYILKLKSETLFG